MSYEASAPLQHLDLPDGSRLAYRALPGSEPGVVFLGGFTSDMSGTKAAALETHCRTRGLAYVRFDYYGHGDSSGRFEDATIGRWTEDAVAVIDRLTRGPQVLVGSSMGGWVMLVAALARPERIRGLIGVAAAPDFTERLVWGRLDEPARTILRDKGMVQVPSRYSEEPTPITWQLIEEGRRHLLLEKPIPLTCPVRLMHGLADEDVPWDISLRLAEALESQDVLVTLVKGGDHRLSDHDSLQRLFAAVDQVALRPSGDEQRR